MMTCLSDAELIWELQQENNELRKALMYYADKKNYNPSRGRHWGVRRVSQVEYDGGKVARKALEGSGNESIKVV